MADTQRYRFPVRFDYTAPVRVWPYRIRVRWPNTILTLYILHQAEDAEP